MVRLKVIIKIKTPTLQKISIPYGAIKSKLVELKKQDEYQISIPYGAIKSFDLVEKTPSYLNFNSLWCD